MLIAVTRPPSDAISRCELTHMEREPIDPDRARKQHAGYRTILERSGAKVTALDPLPDKPDASFVEDVLLVYEEVVVVCRMGAASRRGEAETALEAVRPYRSEFRAIEAPATIEGGDVFRMGKEIFVGESTRTNREGAEALRSIIEPLGYNVHRIPVTGCLHLSTGASHVGDELILANPEWIDTSAFKGRDVLHVHPDEPWAANAMLVGDVVVMCDCFPKTRALLEERGLAVETVDISEFMKAEAGLTCLRLLFEDDPSV